MVDLHRHNHFSLFDGFGNTLEMARLAKEKGYTSLGSSNHGNISDAIKHYYDCTEVGIKPIIGTEAYFQPVFKKDEKSYHLCLFAKNLKGFENINNMLTIAAQEYFYYKPIITFDLLKKYSEGVICTSACVAGILSQMVLQQNKKLFVKALQKFVSIFGDDFYIEIMPYKIDTKGTQEKVNFQLIKMAEEFGVKCILTSDSHYGSKDDFDSYLKMHEINGSTYDIRATYSERFMPNPVDFISRFLLMHNSDHNNGSKWSLQNAFNLAKDLCDNLEEIENKVDGNIFNDINLTLPIFDQTQNSAELLVQKVKEGLKERGHFTDKLYKRRCKKELEIILYHEFQDYFLIVQDYVKWAKANGIVVGPGRGSVCNSLVAYALGITEVDSIKFDLDFTRFLRKDKTGLPDIDLDFEVKRRSEVINYIAEKYKGHVARIGAYGGFKADNLLNDLFKVCGVNDEVDKSNIKLFAKKYIDPDNKILLADKIVKDPLFRRFNKKFDNIIKHFIKLYGKVRYFGTHAAGVAISGNKISSHTSLRRYQNELISAYDHFDLEKAGAVKLDVLGLKNLSEIEELERMTGKKFDISWVDDANVLENFKKGNTDGIFQFESTSAKSILVEMQADCIKDIIAANALNRPGPLSLGMSAQYAENKFKGSNKGSIYLDYTLDTYGTVVYQEQITAICRNIGKLSWADSDKIMKLMKSAAHKKEMEDEIKGIKELFIAGALENGVSKIDAHDIFDKILTYSFNKGHATGYALLAVIDMFYKTYFPTEFFYTKIKYSGNEKDRYKYIINAVKNGTVIFLPHANYSFAEDSLRTIDNELVLQEGISSIKGIGIKTAEIIVQQRLGDGPYLSEEDFIKRCKVKGSGISVKTIERLRELGALEFNEKTYLRRVVKYNSALYARN